MKKYTIAQSEEELQSNLKYISGEFTIRMRADKKSTDKKKSKQSNISWIEKMILIRPFYDYNETLCKVYLDEIKLFYLIHNYSKNDLAIRKCLLIKKHERHIAILIPIILSLIASIVYSIFFTNFLPFFWNNILSNVWNACAKIAMPILLHANVIIHNLSEVISILVLLMILALMIGIFLLFILEAVILFFNIIVCIIGGFDFSKVVAKEYEIEHISELIATDTYFLLTEKVDILSDVFYGNVNQLINNSLIINDSVSVDEFEKDIEEKFMINSIIDCKINKDMLNICDKQIIIKSIIFRAILKNNEYARWEYSQGMLKTKIGNREVS